MENGSLKDRSRMTIDFHLSIISSSLFVIHLFLFLSYKFSNFLLFPYMYVLFNQSQDSIFIKRHFESKFIVDTKWTDDIFYYIDMINRLQIRSLSFIYTNLILCMSDI